MALPNQIFAPSFRHQRLSLLFAAMVGIMVYVATFAMAAEATLSAISFNWDKDMQSRVTVELPAIGDEASASQADTLQQTLSVLNAMPDVATVTVLPDSEVARLLKPWFSQPEVLKAIPLPTLIDVTKKPDAQIDAATIKSRLKSVAPGAEVDDHAAWLADMERFVYGLAAVAALTILLTGALLMMCVNLMCRAIMATEHETLTLLHALGAEDSDIAVNFQFHAQRAASPAAWVGFVFALLSAGAALFFLRRFADPGLLAPLHWAGLGAATLAVPLAAIVIASFAARRASLKLLSGLP